MLNDKTALIRILLKLFLQRSETTVDKRGSTGKMKGVQNSHETLRSDAECKRSDSFKCSCMINFQCRLLQSAPLFSETPKSDG